VRAESTVTIAIRQDVFGVGTRRDERSGGDQNRW
jgi:hypothetical protein